MLADEPDVFKVEFLAVKPVGVLHRDGLSGRAVDRQAADTGIADAEVVDVAALKGDDRHGLALCGGQDRIGLAFAHLTLGLCADDGALPRGIVEAGEIPTGNLAVGVVVFAETVIVGGDRRGGRFPTRIALAKQTAVGSADCDRDHRRAAQQER